MVSVPLIINDFIVTSLLLLKFYCVGQLLDFTADTLLFNFIWLYGYFEGIFDFAVKFSNMTS